MTLAGPDRGEWVERLLQVPDQAARLALWRAAGRYSADGIADLLQYGRAAVTNEPDRVATLAGLAGVAAAEVAPDLVPEADYLHAQSFAVRGQFGAARPLIERARRGFEAVGRPLDAWRTTAGLMMILGETGAYDAALAAGAAALDGLAQVSSAEARRLEGMIQQNRGMCLAQRGDYAAALEAYSAAEARYAASGAVERQSSVMKNRGVLLLDLGRGREALATFEAAGAMWDERGDPLRYGGQLANVGYAQLQLGRYSDALAQLQAAYTVQRDAGLTAFATQKQVDVADAYLHLNLAREAADLYREAAAGLTEAGMSHYLGRAHYGLGLALLRLEDRAGAAEQLAAAGRVFDAAGALPQLAEARLAQAGLADDDAGGRALGEQVLARLAPTAQPRQYFETHLFLAERTLRLGLPDAAAAHLAAAEAAPIDIAAVPRRYQLHFMRGRLARARGNSEEAVDQFQAAVADVEQLRGMVLSESIRTPFLADKVALYAELVDLMLARGDVAAAFEMAERAKSRTLLERMAGLIDAQLEDGLEAAQAAELRRLRDDLNAIYNRLLGGHGDAERGAVPPGALDRTAAQLERAWHRLLQQYDAMTPFNHGLDVDFDVSHIQHALPAETTLLAYHFLADEVVAFVVDGDGLTMRRQLTTVAHVRRLEAQLQVQWRLLHAGRHLSPTHMRQLAGAADRVLRALHAALVAPLRDVLGHERLVIVPHGVLHRLPFHAFFDGARYLLDDFAISYAPSATVFAVCQHRPMPAVRRMVAFGVNDETLTGAVGEARTVAAGFDGGRAYTGLGATTEAFRAAAPNSGWLHLACHGLFRADNPMFSALRLHDGWLTAHDIARLRLPAGLVTLSACESGVTGGPAGDEILGLTRAFLAAGAATLLVSLWRVADRVAAEMMPRWYAALAARPDPAQALREVQLALREQYVHPFHWSPFVLVGRR